MIVKPPDQLDAWFCPKCGAGEVAVHEAVDAPLKHYPPGVWQEDAEPCSGVPQWHYYRLER